MKKIKLIKRLLYKLRNKNNTKFYKIFGYLFLGLSLLIIILVLIIKLLQNTIFNNDNYIRTVYFTKESVGHYYDSGLYMDIRSQFLGQNIYFLKYLGGIYTLSNDKDINQIIQHIDITKYQKNTLTLNLDFENPKMIMIGSGNQRGVWSDSLSLLLSSGQNISNGIIQIYMPSYITELTSMSGFRADVGFDKYYGDIIQIQKSFDHIQKMIYMIGSSRTCIFIDDIKIFFNHNKDIDLQIKNLKIILGKTVFENNKKLEDTIQIDLGSLENPIITFR